MRVPNELSVCKKYLSMSPEPFFENGLMEKAASLFIGFSKNCIVRPLRPHASESSTVWTFSQVKSQTKSSVQKHLQFCIWNEDSKNGYFNPLLQCTNNRADLSTIGKSDSLIRIRVGTFFLTKGKHSQLDTDDNLDEFIDERQQLERVPTTIKHWPVKRSDDISEDIFELETPALNL